MTLNPLELDSSDVKSLRDCGISDEGIEDLIQVCFVFSVLNRLADAFDFEIPQGNGLRNQSKVMYWWGYKLTSFIG